MESLEQQAERILADTMPATPDELRQALIGAEIGINTHKRAHEEFVGPFLKNHVTVEELANA